MHVNISVRACICLFGRGENVCNWFLTPYLTCVSLSSSGGACTAAAFLREFVTATHWAHLDIAGVMSNKDEIPYLRKGMSGRPTRTLVEFAAGLASQA